MPIADRKKIAILIDAENTSSRYIKLILEGIDSYGSVTYMRIYGKSESLTAWKEVSLTYAMTPVMQFNYTNGKNASDSALIIDAMDILYIGNVDGFCLVTSDSDFTKLAIRLREAGKFVIGMGERKTPLSLVNACEEFRFLDELYKTEAKLEDVKTSESPLPNLDELKDRISKVFDTIFNGNEWVRLADLGNALPKSIPGFDVKLYGSSKLKKLMERLSDRFEMREIAGENSVPDLYVRDKQ